MESIYQSRGFVSCLKQGFTFVLANPKTVMKAMWVLLLIISISDVLLYGFIEKMSMDVMRSNIGTSTVLAALGFYGAFFLQILLLVVGLFYFGRYMIKREEKKYRVKAGKLILRNFWSFLGIFLMYFFLGLLLTLIPLLSFMICSSAYNNCMMSELFYSDVVSIPTSGYVSMFIIGVLALFVSEYLGFVVPASLIYKYGSVVYNEQNK